MARGNPYDLNTSRSLDSEMPETVRRRDFPSRLCTSPQGKSIASLLCSVAISFARLIGIDLTLGHFRKLGKLPVDGLILPPHARLIFRTPEFDSIVLLKLTAWGKASRARFDTLPIEVQRLYLEGNLNPWWLLNDRL